MTYINKLTLLYPWVGIKLVGVVGGVLQNDDDKLLIAVIVSPMSSPSWDSKNVALSELLDFLMAVEKPLPPLFLLLLLNPRLLR